jgi:hypothetical protein
MAPFQGSFQGGDLPLNPIHKRDGFFRVVLDGPVREMGHHVVRHGDHLLYLNRVHKDLLKDFENFEFLNPSRRSHPDFISHSLTDQGLAERRVLTDL